MGSSQKHTPISRTLQKLLRRSARIPLASLNYYLGNYEEPIWLVSDGRSGSTWLSDLINYDRRYRELFEPFHPHIVKEAEEFSLFQYLDPEDTESDLGKFLESVFSGRFKHLRADVSQPQLIYKGLLIKDIFAHLLMPWVSQNIPNAKTILLIRNPFAVALSKQRLQNWTWMTNPKDLLLQQLLYDQYLHPFEDIIQAAGDDFIENQVLIWAIIHYVPLQFLSQKNVYIAFYEDFVSRPAEEIEKLFKYLGVDHSKDQDLLNRIYKPTRTSKDFKATPSRESLVGNWKNQLSTEQIDKGLKMLEHFQLDKIYADSAKPNRAALAQGKFALQNY